ncbi:MAG: SET domain-containing protein [Pyrinomonadaceae bacterium]
MHNAGTYSSGQRGVMCSAMFVGMDHERLVYREGESAWVRQGSIRRAVPRIDGSKAWFRLEVRRSKIHRWGVFALEPIPALRRVIEYTGEKIDQEEHERRSDGASLLYFFTLSKNRVIDPSVGGSGAEFINHSCDGNLDSYVYGGHIYISSNRRIEAGEELSYDYNIQGDYDAECRCGASNCRGRLKA